MVISSKGMTMNFDFCVSQLTHNAVAIQHLVEGIDPEQARWKPNAESWSVLEVINHLADEEREDFRTRVRHVLAGSTEPAPPIRPGAWVTERSYNTRDLSTSVADFLRERQASLDWLKGLQNPNWDTTFTRPEFSIRAGDLMVAWAAHDVLHLRQLVELKRAYSLTQFAPYSPDYAGEW
jgi:hypothetical protein